MPTLPPAPWKPGEPGYGVVEYADGRARFVCFSPLTHAALVELCAVARQHGAKPTSTDGWLIKSIGVSEPKE